MNILRKLIIGSSLLRSKWSGKKRPLAIGWSLTKRCNFNCAYCGSKRRVGRELTDDQLQMLANQIVDAGVLKVAFTGGEPLLRPKIVDLVGYLSDHGLSVTIDTNGALLPKMIDHLHGLEGVLLSLDGPENVNDLIRGKGAYVCALDALEAAHKNDLRIVMTCVLSRWNLDAFEHVLQIAKQFDATVQFQPATQSLLGVDDENPATPAPDDFQKTVSRIIELKNSQYKNQVGNSLVGLNHLRRWPAPVPVRCISGLVSGRIEPDGALYHCGRVIAGTKNPPNVLDKGFRAAFEKLAPFDCSDCWCAQRVELMLATEFKIDAIRNMFNIY